MLARYEHAMADARIVRHHEADPGFVVEPTHDLLGVALENLDDRAFGAAAMIGAIDSNRSPVAVHGLEHLSWREKDGRRAVIRQQKAMPILVCTHGADGQR